MTAESRKLYLECTTTYQYDHGTGIPRVVRNVIRHLRPLAKARGFDVVPVHFAGGALHPAVLTPAGDLAAPPKPFGEHILGTGRDAVRRVARMLPAGGLRDWLVAPSSERGLARAARRLVSVAGTRIAAREPQTTSGGIQPRRGDVLVLVDVSLGVDMKPTLALFQRAGVTIGALVYDLIPLQHPEWCPAGFCRFVPGVARTGAAARGPDRGHFGRGCRRSAPAFLVLAGGPCSSWAECRLVPPGTRSRSDRARCG